MLIDIAQDYSVALIDPQDFKKFSIRVNHNLPSFSQVKEATHAVGTWIDENAMWVSEDWLRKSGDCCGDSQWQEAVSVMIATAEKYGWVDRENQAIRAHAVWASDSV